MLRNLFIIITIVCVIPLRATECSDRLFIEKHINFNLCQYHSRETNSLLFKGRIKAINEYIARKIENGELEAKKFEISMEDPLSIGYLHLQNAKKAYYVSIGGTSITLQRLKLIVDKFSVPTFKLLDLSCCIDDAEVKAAAREKFWEQVGQPDSLMLQFEHTIWKKDSLQIIYRGDSLAYVLFGKTIPTQVKFAMPSKIRNRYIIPILVDDGNSYPCIDHFFVYQDSVLIMKYKIPNLDQIYDEEDIRAYVGDAWINFCRYDECTFSYSYDKNKFYYFEKPINIKKER